MQEHRDKLTPYKSTIIHLSFIWSAAGLIHPWAFQCSQSSAWRLP